MTPVLQGTNGHDVAGRTAEHALCLDTDRQDALVVLVDGDNRGLANDDALAAHGDKRIGGAEVDGKIARISYRRTYPSKKTTQLLMCWMIAGKLLAHHTGASPAPHLR